MGLADFQLSSDGGATYAGANVAFADAAALAYSAAGTWTIVARPISSAGWSSFAWSIVTADDNHYGALPVITTNPDKSCTFTIPKTGGAWTLELLVDNGVDQSQNNAIDPGRRRRLSVKARNSSGNQELAVGEALEASATTGYVKAMNEWGRGGPVAVAGIGTIAVSVDNTVANFDSTFVAPTGSLIDRITVFVLTNYDAGSTITVGTPAAPGSFLTSTDVDITATGGPSGRNKSFVIYNVLGANKVRVVRAGVAVAGRCTVYASYSVPVT